MDESARAPSEARIIVKAAKRVLKKSDAGRMRVKALARAVLERLGKREGAPVVTKKAIKAALRSELPKSKRVRVEGRTAFYAIRRPA